MIGGLGLALVDYYRQVFRFHASQFPLRSHPGRGPCSFGVVAFMVLTLSDLFPASDWLVESATPF